MHWEQLEQECNEMAEEMLRQSDAKGASPERGTHWLLGTWLLSLLFGIALSVIAERKEQAAVLEEQATALEETFKGAPRSWTRPGWVLATPAPIEGTRPMDELILLENPEAREPLVNLYVDGSDRSGCASDSNDCKTPTCEAPGRGPCKTLCEVESMQHHSDPKGNIHVISMTGVDRFCVPR